MPRGIFFSCFSLITKDGKFSGFFLIFLDSVTLVEYVHNATNYIQSLIREHSELR